MDRKPIVLIPGIQGTKLTNTNNVDFKTIWSGAKKFYTNLHDLLLQFNGASDLGPENIIERADVENLAYSEIVNYLRSLGYRVYIFGYDWRKSNVESGEKLLSFVKRIQSKLKEPKINFITHSMGCLVLSSMMKLLSDTDKEKFINKVIFTVPPFLGSIEATYNLVIGKSRLFNSSDDFRKVGKTFPGLYELLPVYKEAYSFSDGKAVNWYDFDAYWQHQISDDPVHMDKLDDKQRLIRHRLEKLGQVRNDNHFILDLSKLTPELKSRCIVLAGGGERTQTKIKIKENQIVNDRTYKFYFDFGEFDDEEKDAGDGTVPLISSTAFADSIDTFRIDTNWIQKRADSHLIMGDWHAFFLNNGKVQNIIQRYFKPDFKRTETWFQSAGTKVDML